jgi:hypothetical protein
MRTWDDMLEKAERIRSGAVPTPLKPAERERYYALVSEMRRLTWEAWGIYGHLCPRGQASPLRQEILEQLPTEDVERLADLFEQEARLRTEFSELTDRALERRRA